MNYRNPLIAIILGSILLSCGSNLDNKKKYFSIKIENNKDQFKLNETVKASINNPENKKIDSIHYFLDQNTTVQKKATYQEILDDELLGHHKLNATIFYEGQSQTVSKKLLFLNDKAPALYSYKIIAEYPHDKQAFTQGLEFNADTLYESTGKKGFSTLRKVNYLTGEILENHSLKDSYFAEGLTIYKDQIYQLTWLARQGFIYDLNTLIEKGTFAYNQSKEGWGLCNDGKTIYKSDGTEKIWKLNPDTLVEESFIQVTTNKGIKSKFNELEWIDGKIYANTWQKDGIAIINPKNGALEGVINLSNLRKRLSNHPDLDVLNGIAYRNDTKQLFVTGKNWDKLFEIEVLK
ncbi:glutaminyl-peptide cyclotransferase [Aquimarina sp. W85]|uniref:glutaminyl-peptide cyclotransferase n=1 Tax=Aquimarina rhodophyticola TaxID=3342246 RepID=UPI00366D19DF